MLSLNLIKEAFEKHDGIMRTNELYDAHIYYHDIQRLIEQGIIEKVRYGYYQLVDPDSPGETATISRLFPDAILCMDTALFFYGYSDRIPLAWHLAVSKDSGKSRFKIDYPRIKPYYLEPSVLMLGVVEKEMDSIPIRIYDKERTICDCLRNAGKMDREIFNKAIRCYVEDKAKNIFNLLEYAKKLRVDQKVKIYIGVWI